jgi:hypothetical protein
MPHINKLQQDLPGQNSHHNIHEKLCRKQQKATGDKVAFCFGKGCIQKVKQTGYNPGTLEIFYEGINVALKKSA